MGAGTRRIWSVWLLPVAYVLAFLGVRTYARVFEPQMLGNPPGTYIGRVVAINGFHVHHIYFGLALIPVALYVALVRRMRALGLALGGIALALIVDEVGLVASGFTVYDHPWTRPLAITTGLVLLLVAAVSSHLAGRGTSLTPPAGPRAP